MRNVESPGFMFVELFVVIAIIGIFIAPLRPAVQAAWRTQPTDNFKQTGLGNSIDFEFRPALLFVYTVAR